MELENVFAINLGGYLVVRQEVPVSLFYATKMVKDGWMTSLIKCKLMMMIGSSSKLQGLGAMVHQRNVPLKPWNLIFVAENLLQPTLMKISASPLKLL